MVLELDRCSDLNFLAPFIDRLDSGNGFPNLQTLHIEETARKPSLKVTGDVDVSDTRLRESMWCVREYYADSDDDFYQR